MRLIITSRNYDAVNTRAGKSPGGEIPKDTYRERLIKYIPAEVLVLYVAAYGSTYTMFAYYPWFPLLARCLFLTGIAVTLLWLWKIDGVDDGIQLVISTAGFVIWIFAFGVIPVSDLPSYNQVAAALMLPVYVFGAPLIDGVPDTW